MNGSLNRRQALALIAAAAAASTRAGGAELRIGYQKSSVNLMVVRERRLLSTEYGASCTACRCRSGYREGLVTLGPPTGRGDTCRQ